jgi:hypothetical protein
VNHISKAFSTSVNPVLEREVTDTITNTLIPAYSDATSAIHRELTRELRSEVANLITEVIARQSEALRNHEVYTLSRRPECLLIIYPVRVEFS